MKMRLCVVVTLVIVASFRLFAQETQPASLPRATSAGALNVDLASDGAILAGGIAAAGLSELLPSLPSPWGGLGAPTSGGINPLDRWLMFPYSHGFDVASTIFQYSTVAVPALVGLAFDTENFIPMGIVYLQAVSYALAAKNLLGYLVPRYRPYVYMGGALGVASSEDDQSFPSGHATVAFAAATAGVTIYAMSFPDSPYLIPFAIASFGMAVTTASFRVAAGMHFVTDIMAGAALGSAIGFFVPFLHRTQQTEDRHGQFSLEISGQDLRIRYSY
jgi:membrane-associated phospholipid phosphatase